MKPSKISLIEHFVGLILLSIGGVMSIASADFTPFLIGAVGCTLLFIFGIETDFYREEAQK